MVKDHKDNEKGNPLSPHHGLLFPFCHGFKVVAENRKITSPGGINPVTSTAELRPSPWLLMNE